MVTENKRYNRIETKNDHFYLNDYGGKGIGDYTIYGYIKCKLAHTQNASTIVPDQVYFNWDGTLRWIQPFNFMPSILHKDDNLITCDVFSDISCGYAVRARFNNKGHIRCFKDGSQLFECELQVPSNVGAHAIGEAVLDDNFNIKVRLYHHTRLETTGLIKQSRYLRGSSWNIQGNKEIEHSDHVYFTPLHELKVNNDLEKVAMSKEARITLMRDGFKPPSVLYPGWEEIYKDDFLVMNVYRENVENRNSSLSFWVPVEILAPQHVIKHLSQDNIVYYEITTAFIHRVQLPKGGCLHFSEEEIPAGQNILFHKQMIIGDGNTLEGMLSPFDEENTPQKFNIQFTENGQSILQTQWNTMGSAHNAQ